MFPRMLFSATRVLGSKASAFILTIALAVALTISFGSTAQAATITVNGLGDTLSNNGVCTIREAIINANNDAATWPDCAAGSGADVINLPAGTITLSLPNTPSSFSFEDFAVLGDLDLLSDITINGNAAGTTIDGGALDRIFDINPDTDPVDMNPTPPITAHINLLTITNGRQNQYGAVKVHPNATVTIDNSTISNSRAWADDAGGVYNSGTLTLTNCTVSGNTALLHAGGIKNEGVLFLKSSTVTDNDSDFDNLAGGIYHSSSMGSSVTLQNTIVAGNGGVDCPNLLGTFTSLGHNIVGEFGTIMGNPTMTATTGDQFDVSDAAVQLGALANNGGPTSTHALGAGSIAIDQGNSSGVTTDQRGETRPCDQAAITNAAGGDGADVGAFEVQGACASPNSAPTAVDDAANVLHDSGANVINVLTNDSDPDTDTLTVTIVTQGANGSVAIVGGGTAVSYTPGLHFVGNDSFTYTIDDGHSHTATATVNVTVFNNAPVAVGDGYSTNSNTPLNVPAPGVLTNDGDPDGDGLTTQLVSGPLHAGSFALNADGSFIYNPVFNYAGPDSFTYKASDGVAFSNTVTVNIDVIDTVPPDLTASVATSSLWPPNHELVNVGLNINASDNSGGPLTISVAVFSDEDDLAPDSGNFSPDAKSVAAGTLRLRSERSGSGDGRVYLIVITATDPSNNVSHACLTVVVPKSQSAADMASVNAQAAAASAYCHTHNGAPPPSFFIVGDGPVMGPKQ